MHGKCTQRSMRNAVYRLSALIQEREKSRSHPHVVAANQPIVDVKCPLLPASHFSAANCPDVQMSSLSKEQHDELCTAYASMILFDGDAEITAEAIGTLITASNNEVEPYWPMLFASTLSKEGKIIELISSGGGAVGAAAGGATAGAAGGDAGAPVEEAKKEEEEEEAVSIWTAHVCIYHVIGFGWRNGYVWWRRLLNEYIDFSGSFFR